MPCLTRPSCPGASPRLCTTISRLCTELGFFSTLVWQWGYSQPTQKRVIQPSPKPMVFVWCAVMLPTAHMVSHKHWYRSLGLYGPSMIWCRNNLKFWVCCNKEPHFFLPNKSLLKHGQVARLHPALPCPAWGRQNSLCRSLRSRSFYRHCLQLSTSLHSHAAVLSWPAEPRLRLWGASRHIIINLC